MADQSKAPKVSILMNCYNGEQFLKDAIDSVYKQTFSSWEIVFINNQSTDQSKEIAESYDEKVRLIDTPHFMNLGEGRDFGLQHCRGDFICFLDTDDKWVPDKLKIQLAVMDQDAHCILLYSGYDKINEQGKSIKKYKPKYQKGNLFGANLVQYEINFQTVMLRREALNCINQPYFNPDFKYCPDHNLFMKILLKGPAVSLPDVLAYYRVRGGSLSSETMNHRGPEIEHTLSELKEDRNFYTWATTDQENVCLAKIAYYKACAAILNGNKNKARDLLRSYKLVDKRFYILYQISRFPFLWNFAHRFKMR